MIQPNIKAKAVLDAIKYATLATVSRDGEPWNTPLAIYHLDDDEVNGNFVDIRTKAEDSQ